MNTEQKTILITGAGNGLGFELTRMYAQTPCRVYALTRVVRQDLTDIADAHPDNVTVLECDIGSTESVGAAMEAISAREKFIDVIFNNAGIHRFKDWAALFETDLDACPSMYNINAVGPLRVVKAALPMLHEGSLIIGISSEGGSIGGMTGTMNYAYCMSKAAMNMGARIMDNWLKGWGIRTLMIHPGRMRSGMRGPHSNIEPSETAQALMQMVEHIDEVPADQMFMDYKGNPIPW